MNKIVFGMMLASGLAVAAPRTYVGTGTHNLPGKKATVAYTTQIVVDEVQPHKLVHVTETYKMGSEAAKSFTSTFHFVTDGTLKVERNGVAIGCGYCVTQKDGSHWCDYKVQTEVGPLHVNMYYHAPTDTLARIGDIITLDGPAFWSDNLKAK